MNMKHINKLIFLAVSLLMAFTSCSPQRQPAASHTPREPLRPSTREILLNQPFRETGMHLGVSNLNTAFTGQADLSPLNADFYADNMHTSLGAFVRYGFADQYGRQSRLALQFGMNYTRFSGSFGSDHAFSYLLESSIDHVIVGGDEDNFFEAPAIESITLLLEDSIGSFKNDMLVFSVKPEIYLIHRHNSPIRLYAFAGLNVMVNSTDLFNFQDDLIITDQVTEKISPSSIAGIGLPLGFGITYKAGSRFRIGYEFEYLNTWGNHPSGIYDPNHNDYYISNRLKIGYRLNP